MSRFDHTEGKHTSPRTLSHEQNYLEEGQSAESQDATWRFWRQGSILVRRIEYLYHE